MKNLVLVGACVIAVAGGTAAQNLAVNGSFNGGLDGWVVEYASYDAALDATGTAGSGSVKGRAPALWGVGAVNQCIAVEPSTTYRAGGKILIPTGQATTGLAGFYVNFFSGTDCSSGYIGVWDSRLLSSANTWQAVDTGLVAPSAFAHSASLGAQLVNSGGAAAPEFLANFDDMFLTSAGDAYERWIPAVIHKDVPSKNAKWRSDVAVLNRGSSSALLTISMYPPSGRVSTTWTVLAGRQLLLADVAGWLGVTADSGPLSVTSAEPFFLSGRTYNQVDETHTYGQNYEGEDPSDLLAAGDAATSTAWLPQLTENTYYRTNIGITNTGAETANVTLTLYDTAGNQVWEDSRDYAPGGFYQYQQPYQPLGGIASGFAKVTVNSGAGLVAYASVTDNNTGDPTTITMKR